jgi:mono/diheme cytochrome c family protein
MFHKVGMTLTAGLLTSSLLVACQSYQPPPYDGQNLYLGYCASCHGPIGAGDGPMAPHLAGTLSDLRTLRVRNDGEFPRADLVEMIDGRSFRSVHGAADMPVWGWQFRREEGMTREGLLNVEARINAVVDHMERLQLN